MLANLVGSAGACNQRGHIFCSRFQGALNVRSPQGSVPEMRGYSPERVNGRMPCPTLESFRFEEFAYWCRPHERAIGPDDTPAFAQQAEVDGCASAETQHIRKGR